MRTSIDEMMAKIDSAEIRRTIDVRFNSEAHSNNVEAVTIVEALALNQAISKALFIVRKYFAGEGLKIMINMYDHYYDQFAVDPLSVRTKDSGEAFIQKVLVILDEVGEG